MFTKELNREMNSVLKERNKLKSSLSKQSTGFSDSDEDEIQTTKSLKSSKSPLSSNRSSLLSARSPRDEQLFSTMKNRNKLFSDSEDDKSGSPRRVGKLSSPSSKNEMPKLPSTNYNKSTNKLDPLGKTESPRFISPRNEKQSLLTTLKSPLNDLKLTSKRNILQDSIEDSPRSPKLSPKKQVAPLNDRRLRRDDLDDDKSTPRTGRSTPNSDKTRKLRQISDDEDDIYSKKTKSTKKELKFNVESNKKPKSPALSPKEQKELKELTKDFEKNASILQSLVTTDDEKKSSGKSSRRSSVDDSDKKKEENLQEEYIRELAKIDENNQKNIEEVAEDNNLTEKLKKQREEKTRLRLEKAKNQTETTQKIEEAIEKVNNANEDEMRLFKLEAKLDDLDYSTKPALDKTRILISDNTASRPPRASRGTERRDGSCMRTRSLSSSRARRFANVKPKVVTRLLTSARDRSFNESSTDLNDSSSLRQQAYEEWYLKKMLEAKENLRRSTDKIKDEEEKKAQELMNKLKKSALVFKMWSEKKDEQIKAKQSSVKKLNKTIEKEKQKEKEKKDVAKKAFEQWKKSKDEELKENSSEKTKKLEIIRDAEKRLKQKKREAAKAYEIWKEKKEKQLKEQLNKLNEKDDKRQKLIDEFYKKKELNKQAYREWLEKKEEQMIREAENRLNSGSLSNSMASLPPFYPASKTTSLGR